MSTDLKEGQIITIDDFMDTVVKYLMPPVPNYGECITIIFANGIKWSIRKGIMIGYFHNKEYADFINQLLLSYDLNSKILKRDSRYIIYIKESEKIGDFLRIINAVNALLYYENIRIYRNRKNNLNRINNCEQANVDKMIM